MKLYISKGSEEILQENGISLSKLEFKTDGVPYNARTLDVLLKKVIEPKLKGKYNIIVYPTPFHGFDAKIQLREKTTSSQ